MLLNRFFRIIQREIKDLQEKNSVRKENEQKQRLSRQVIGRYLNREPEPGYTLRLTYMHKQYPCTVIDVDYLNRRVKIQNRTGDLLHRAFGVNETPDWDAYEQFLESRCFPRSRGNLKELLRDMGLDSYDPIQIIEKTHGRTFDDAQWIKLRPYPEKAEGVQETE